MNIDMWLLLWSSIITRMLRACILDIGVSSEYWFVFVIFFIFLKHWPKMHKIFHKWYDLMQTHPKPAQRTSSQLEVQAGRAPKLLAPYICIKVTKIIIYGFWLHLPSFNVMVPSKQWHYPMTKRTSQIFESGISKEKEEHSLDYFPE